MESFDVTLPRTSPSGGVTFDPRQINERAFAYYERLHRVKRYVEEHYMDPPTLATCAAVACLQESYFSTFFHQKVGVRFHIWLTYVRIERAKTILLTRNATIESVAHAVGYSDIRTFQRAFTRTAGETPSAFRTSARPVPRSRGQ